MVVCGVSFLIMGILVLHVNKRKAAVGSSARLAPQAKLTRHRRSCRTESPSCPLPAHPSVPARHQWRRPPTGLDRPCCPHCYPRRLRRCSLLDPLYERPRIHPGAQLSPLPVHLTTIYQPPANVLHRSLKMGRWHPSSCVSKFWSASARPGY